jgi:hypothetical protein
LRKPHPWLLFSNASGGNFDARAFGVSIAVERGNGGATTISQWSTFWTAGSRALKSAGSASVHLITAGNDGF